MNFFAKLHLLLLNYQLFLFCQILYSTFFNGAVQSYLSWGDMSHWLVLSQLSACCDISIHTMCCLSWCPCINSIDSKWLTLCQYYSFKLLFIPKQWHCQTWCAFTIHISYIYDSVLNLKINKFGFLIFSKIVWLSAPSDCLHTYHTVIPFQTDVNLKYYWACNYCNNSFHNQLFCRLFSWLID